MVEAELPGKRKQGTVLERQRARWGEQTSSRRTWCQAGEEPDPHPACASGSQVRFLIVGLECRKPCLGNTNLPLVDRREKRAGGCGRELGRQRKEPDSVLAAESEGLCAGPPLTVPQIPPEDLVWHPRSGATFPL